ncbi:MAG: single-stranded DNA-binding protein [Thermoleophilia bacterium]
MADHRRRPDHRWLEKLEGVTDDLAAAVDQLEFGPPVAYVYNPLRYARAPYLEYLRRFGRPPKQVLLVGMNPGPFGMAQTGVPFGDVTMVSKWMRINGEVDRPAREHPKRPVLGFRCPRSEVSGTRLWGWARSRFGPPEAFFARFFVANYCPLVFMEENGRNRTPDRLPRPERETLFDICDAALRRTSEILGPEIVIGVGRFAENRVRAALGTEGPRIGRILHPSPANPEANRDWERRAEEQLVDLGVEL